MIDIDPQFFQRSARCWAAEREWGLPLEIEFYYLAIASELALDAYLLMSGIDFEWIKRFTRHDLSKKLKLARLMGLPHTTGLPKVINQISPYYRTHRLDYFVKTCGDVPPILITRVMVLRLIELCEDASYDLSPNYARPGLEVPCRGPLLESSNAPSRQ